MKELIKKIKLNYALLAFLGYAVKLLVIEVSYPDALVIACMAALYGWKMRIQLMEPRKDINADVIKDVQEIKNALSKANVAKIATEKKNYGW